MLTARSSTATATRGLLWDCLVQSACWLLFAGCLGLSYWRPELAHPHLGTLFVLAVAVVLILPLWQFFSALHFSIEYGRRWQLWIIGADVFLLLASVLLSGYWDFWSGYGIRLLFLFSLLHTVGCWIDYLRSAAALAPAYPELLDVELGGTASSESGA